MKAIFASFVYLAVITAVHSKGLRGIISYTYDDSFEGAKLYGQELSQKAFEKLLSTKDFGSEPRVLSSTYSIFGLLDGKCDVKFECCKNCDRTCSAPTPTVPAFLSTPSVIEHRTSPTTRKIPPTRKVTTQPPVVVETTPEATTKATTTKPRVTEPPPTPKITAPRKPIESRKTKPRKVKVPDTNILVPLLPGDKPGRVNRMINHPSSRPFRGPPYLPQPEVSTERVDHTWKTYAHRDVTYPTHTWQPFIATGTWIPNTATYEPVTAAPKYVGPSKQLDGAF